MLRVFLCAAFTCKGRQKGRRANTSQWNREKCVCEPSLSLCKADELICYGSYLLLLAWSTFDGQIIRLTHASLVASILLLLFCYSTHQASKRASDSSKVTLCRDNGRSFRSTTTTTTTTSTTERATREKSSPKVVTRPAWSAQEAAALLEFSLGSCRNERQNRWNSKREHNRETHAGICHDDCQTKTKLPLSVCSSRH